MIKIVYILNIIVAGYIGVVSIVNTDRATKTIFSNIYSNTELIKLVGCLWLAIALLSVGGLWKPLQFSPVLILQLIYKSIWLIAVAIPGIYYHKSYPSGMAIFFLIWVLVLPFIIPWKYFW